MTAFFNPSTLAVSAACQQIADTVGASGDSVQTTRAYRSLFDTLTYLNRTAWTFAQVEATPISVLGPFNVALTASAGQVSAVALTNHGVKVDDFILGSGFSAGTRVSATGNTSLGFNLAITGFGAGLQNVTVTANRDLYDLPSDWNQAYTVRLLVSNRTLRLYRRRPYDQSTVNEFTNGQPEWYDIFPIGAKGKMRLLPGPSSNDTLFYRYYRRITVPSASADAVSPTLDIPQDYEGVVMARAKWHYLTDKGDGRSDQAGTWLQVFQDGYTSMIRAQVNLQDEIISFYPGYAQWPYNVNSTRTLPFEYS